MEQFFRSYADAVGVSDTDHYQVMDRLLNGYIPDEPLRVRTVFSGTRENPEQRGSIKNISTSNFTPAALIYGVLDGMAHLAMYEEAAYGAMLSGMIAEGIRPLREIMEM